MPDDVVSHISVQSTAVVDRIYDHRIACIWHHSTLIILDLGGNHTQMRFLGAIGSLMAGPGLKEIWLDSGMSCAGSFPSEQCS